RVSGAVFRRGVYPAGRGRTGAGAGVLHAGVRRRSQPVACRITPPATRGHKSMPWFRRLAMRLGNWWRSRNPRLLVRALPAVVLGTVALSMGMAAYARREAETTALYIEEAKGRFKAQDYAGAMTCYDRLAHLGGSRPEVLFGLALTAQALGEQERAALLMTELAPPDRRGYSEAHL